MSIKDTRWDLFMFNNNLTLSCAKQRKNRYIFAPISGRNPSSRVNEKRQPLYSTFFTFFFPKFVMLFFPNQFPYRVLSFFLFLVVFMRSLSPDFRCLYIHVVRWAHFINLTEFKIKIMLSFFVVDSLHCVLDGKQWVPVREDMYLRTIRLEIFVLLNFYFDVIAHSCDRWYKHCSLAHMLIIQLKSLLRAFSI